MPLLPTAGRGPLYSAFGVGWPCGRGLVILSSTLIGVAQWRLLFVTSGVLLFGLVLVLTLASSETPRYLAMAGDTQGAVKVLTHMSRCNGNDFNHSRPLHIEDESQPLKSAGSLSTGDLSVRLAALRRLNSKEVAYGMALMTSLAASPQPAIRGSTSARASRLASSSARSSKSKSEGTPHPFGEEVTRASKLYFEKNACKMQVARDGM